MAALDGTIKTPLGAVQKKTALLLGGGAVVLGFIVWYRQKQLGDTSTVGATDAPINPATGYPYGSPEDAAALQAQEGYVSPAAPASPGGSGSIPTSNVGYATNGAWTNAVVQNMIGNGLVEDPAQLSSALGKYITGAYASDTDVNLIQQAIAAEGFPPIAGPNGYPPSINRNAPTTPTTTPPVNLNPGPISGRVTTVYATSVSTRFNGAANAASYQIFLNNILNRTITGSPFSITGLKKNTAYTIGIRAVGKNGSFGPLSNSSFRTKAK